MSDPEFAQRRQEMLGVITAQTVFLTGRLGKAALDRRVMAAMAEVPRHEFVPPELQPFAYADSPLPIGCGKTISQPFIVALMTDLLDPAETDVVLEVGTGLGYQSAVLARLVRQVYSIELIDELAAGARQRFARLGIQNIEVRIGDGRAGWPEHAPFRKIIVTAAPESVPPELIRQLAPGGTLVIPAGPPESQQLLKVVKDSEGRVSTREVLPVRFSALEEQG